MDSHLWKPTQYTVDELELSYRIPHHACPASDIETEGNCFFAVELDRYQLDELAANNYTLVNELCSACYGFTDIIVRYRTTVKKLL